VETPHICKSLQAVGISEPLSCLLQSYLKNRAFRIRIGSHLSSTHSQVNGIPEDSPPPSGTLFSLANTDVVSTVPSPLRTILFADDLSIHLETRNNQTAQRLLQEAIVGINNWLTHYGFRVSTAKTQLVIFRDRRGPITPLTLLVRQNQIPS